MDISTSSGGELYGIERSLTFNSSVKEAAEININLRRTSGKGTIEAVHNSAQVHQRENVTINVSLTGQAEDLLIGFQSFDVYKAAPQIKVELDNNGGEANSRRAVEYCQGISLTEGGRVELHGRIFSSSIPLYANPNTVTTTPENNQYVWIETDTKPIYSSDFVLSNLDGTPCYTTVFEYAADPAPLVWAGGSHFNIPGTVIEDNISINLMAGVRGGTYYNSDDHYWNFEVLEGTLPEGLVLNSRSGLLIGQPKVPCEAGSVKIKVTDRAGTYGDLSDDRYVEFWISYGACVDKDRFLTVGDADPVEMKQDGAGSNWSYVAATSTLTLNNYSGGPIKAERPFNIHLIGENTITPDEGRQDGSYRTYGIWMETKLSEPLRITAEEGGELHIQGNTLKTDFCLMDVNWVEITNGTVLLTAKSDFSNKTFSQGIGFLASLSFTQNEDQAASVTVDLQNTSATVAAELSGNGTSSNLGGIRIEDRDNVTLSVSVQGNANTEVRALSGLSAIHTNARITAVAYNGENSSKDCLALQSLSGIVLKEGGLVDLTGIVRTNSLPSIASPHTVTTTPDNNAYYWCDIDPHEIYNRTLYELRNLQNAPIKHTVFAYSSEKATFKWTGEGLISLPGGTIGDSLQLDLQAALIGAHGYYTDGGYCQLEIVRGSLPEGLTLGLYNHIITGTVTAPCEEGSVWIKATDCAGTPFDNSDDRVIEEFELHYGAFSGKQPVTDITLDMPSLTLENTGTGTVTATVSPSDASYPYVEASQVAGNGEVSVLTISDPVDGVSTITLKAWGTPGTFVYDIRTLELGLAQTLAVYVLEATPQLSIDYENEQLTGFQIGKTYRITPDELDPIEFTAETYDYAIPAEWLGKTIRIVCLYTADETCNSPAQELLIPARPAAPIGLEPVDASSAEDQDGIILGVASNMAWQEVGQDSWRSIYGDFVEHLAVGSYRVRYQATNNAFASLATTVTVGYCELEFEDDAAFDILGGETESHTWVDVSDGVWGGKQPYTFSMEGPDWLSINATTGVISGARPNSEQAATTATVTVTDGDSNSRSITINIGAVVLPHVHVYDQQNTDDAYRASAADCENAAYYHYSCVCGDKGSNTFPHGEKLGHDYTEKIEDEAHLKEKGADCQHSNTYWYDCSRCSANAKDDPLATDKFYSGTSVGDHSFDTENWGYKDADGHAHLCTVENCGAHDTPVAHTPGDEATELAPQLCTACSYEIAPKKPHVHSIQERSAASPDCTNPGNIAYYYCTGLCGKYFSDAEGTQEIVDKTSVVLPALGHDYSEKLQNEAHVKDGGSNCRELYVYWFNCSRCTACAKDDPAAADSYYTGTLYGEHEYDQTSFAYRDAQGHARVCKTEGCGHHDMLRDHNQDTSSYQKDGTNHWYVCSDCGYEMSVTAHVYTNDCDTECNVCFYTRSITHQYQEVLSKDASKHWYECSVCAARKEEADHVFDNDCDATCNTCGHTRSANHSYISEWTRDETKHWHTCSVCGQKKDESDHFPGPAATETEPQICTVCAQVLSPATGHITHTPADAWSSDATHHWHSCIGCQEQQYQKGEHDYDHACDATCNTCSYQRSIAHDYKTDWSKNEQKHWLECSVCQNKKEEADHVFDNACDTDCNTCGARRETTHSYSQTLFKNDGKHWYECTACGAKKEEADHTFDHTCDPSCDLCGYTRTVSHSYAQEWSKNQTKHWHACTACGSKTEETTHTPGPAATESTPQLCTVCGYIIAPATGHSTHTPSDAWSSDATHHWHECTGCQDQQLAKEEHTYDNACDTECNTCGKSRTVTHDYKTDWQSNAQGHWHECSICSARKDENSHTPGAAATETTPQICTVCGYIIAPATTPDTEPGTEPDTEHMLKLSGFDKN